MDSVVENMSRASEYHHRMHHLNRISPAKLIWKTKGISLSTCCRYRKRKRIADTNLNISEFELSTNQAFATNVNEKGHPIAVIERQNE